MKKLSRSWVLFAFIGVLGLALFLGLYEKANPEAALTVSITKAEAEDSAKNYLAGLGYSVDGFNSATVFSLANPSAESFLQKKLGVAGFNAWTGNPENPPLWSFVTRFYKELHEEEFSVYVSERGIPLGFARNISETDAGLKLSKNEALEVARAFAEGVGGLTLQDFVEKGYQEIQKQERVDHLFTFERRGSEIAWGSGETSGKGSSRLDVLVQGDKVGFFSRYFYVPEDFLRNEDELLASGEFFLIIAGLFELLLLCAGLFVFLTRFKIDDLRPRAFVVIALFLLILNSLDTLFSSSGLYFDYPTTVPLSQYLTQALVFFFVGSLIAFLYAVFLGSVGETLTREQFPEANSFDSTATPNQRVIVEATLKGVCAGFGFLGYISLFYYIGFNYLGVWAPLSISAGASVSSFLPALSAMAVAFGAAFSEELSFRFFGVSFFKKYAKNIFLAVLIPAVIWAFLHSTYLIFPMYVRGIELTIAGIAFGYLFVKEGIIAAIVAHYIVDVVLFTTPLIRGGNPLHVVSSVLALCAVALIPFAYSVFGRRS